MCCRPVIRHVLTRQRSRDMPRLAVAAEGIAEAAAGGAHFAQLHARMLEQSIVVVRGDLAPLQDAARAHAVTIVCGLNERDGEAGGGTLYNSVVVIGPDGTLLNRHRKLVPTSPERMVWGFGDGSGLHPVETPAGRIGVLICWENYMPLARYALYARGVEIYIAPTYDAGENWIGTLRRIAREGAYWVAGSGCALRGRDLPADLPARCMKTPASSTPISIAPRSAQRTLDVVGYYSRPDVLQLQLNARPQSPLLVQ
jgi:nitrilase